MRDQANKSVTSPTSPDFVDSVFPPMYYDSPAEQIVIGTTIQSDDNLTAAIIAGLLYFKISKIDVCDWVPDLPPEKPGPAELPIEILDSTIIPLKIPIQTWLLSDPITSSDGEKPLVVRAPYERLVQVFFT